MTCAHPYGRLKFLVEPDGLHGCPDITVRCLDCKKDVDMMSWHGRKTPGEDLIYMPERRS